MGKINKIELKKKVLKNFILYKFKKKNQVKIVRDKNEFNG